MSLFNFEFAPLIGLGCVGSTFYTTLMITTMLPMAVLFLMFAFYRISKSQVTRFYNSKEPYTKATDLELHRWLSQLKVKCTKYALTLLLLVYPSVSRTVLLTFKVRGPIEGVNYIEADMRLPAEGGAYNAAAVWAVLMVMLYPIGILVLCFYFVWKYREQLHDPKVQERFGMLYAGVSCTESCYYPYLAAHFSVVTVLRVYICSMNIVVGTTRVWSCSVNLCFLVSSSLFCQDQFHRLLLGFSFLLPVWCCMSV
jgi:hypothetical protein